MKHILSGAIILWTIGCTPSSQSLPSPPENVEPRTEGEQTLQITTRNGNFVLELSNLWKDMDANPPQPGRAWIKLIKTDPIAGEVEWGRIQEEGKVIGWSKDNSEMTSLHRVYSPTLKRLVDVDFNTGAVLERIDIDKCVAYDRRTCVILEKLLAKCPGAETTRDHYWVNEAVVFMSTGRREVFQLPSGPGPKPNALCAAHGGVMKPKWSEKEIRDSLTRDATTLYFEAEDGWLSRNPRVRRASQAAYRRLLKEFAGEDVVTLNRERIKSRAEAEIDE